jgi:ribosome maturation factor RimP
MIEKALVAQLVEERIANTDLFIVAIDISTSNKIKVVIDGDQGVSIEQCISVSRNVEHNLDREVEDFSLEVSSYGLSQPLILPRQFAKYIGKSVEVITNEDKKLSGILRSHTPEQMAMELELTKKQIKEGVEAKITLDFDAVKEVKSKISFK